MDKRGEAETLQLTMLFEILIGIAIASFLILAALNWNSVSNFNKVYVQEDLKLLSNAVMSVPGEMQVKYPLSSNLKIEMTPDYVKVLSKPGFFSLYEDSYLLLTASSQSDQIGIKRLENE